MNILLINPRSDIFLYKTPPLGILYIASVLRKSGYPGTFILDADAEKIDPARLGSILQRINPAVVGITAIAFTYRQAIDTLRVVKQVNPGIFTVIGGVHPTSMPEECIRNEFCDCVVIGEGEFSFKEVCEAVENGRGLAEVKGIIFKNKGKPIIAPARDSPPDLDTLPLPAYDLIDINLYTNPFNYSLVTSARVGEPVLPILGSRGCCYKCACCGNDIWGNRVRLRSPGNIVNEISYLIKQYNIHNFHFFDGIFTIDRERVRQLCAMIDSQGLGIKWICTTRLDLIDAGTLSAMKKSGCELITYGVESVSQPVLDRLNKDISVAEMERGILLTKSLGINCSGSFIIGSPGDNKMAVGRTISFARRYLDMASFGAPVIFPKTGFARIAEKENNRRIFTDWESFSCSDTSKVMLISKDMSQVLLKYLIYKAYLLFYTNPRVLGKYLYKILTSGQIVDYIRHIFLFLRSFSIIMIFSRDRKDKVLNAVQLK